MSEQLALAPGYLLAHLRLTLLALAAGTAVAVPVGVWAARRPVAGRAVLAFASVAQTVPGLALLAVMVPLLAVVGQWSQALLGVSVPSIGFLPAALALTLYSLLPILRNTVTGLAGVPSEMVEAARAVGMKPAQRLWRVELPLALPVIVAGVRTSAVWVVGTATLSTPVGAPSLGNFIFSGLQTRNPHAVLVGCVGAAALAMALDQSIRLLQRGLTRGRRRWAAMAVGLLVLLGAVVLGLLRGERAGVGGDAPIVVGAKTFTEQYILGEIVRLRLGEATGARVELKPSLGSTVAFDALVAGEVDVYVDYSGTLWATVLERSTVGVERGQVLRQVADDLAREHGVTVVGALGFENAYALAMRRDRARELGIETLTALAGRSAELAMGADYEFYSRAEWRELERAYGFGFRERRSMDPSLMYAAVARDQVQVISAFSSDGRIAAYDLLVLEDDRGVIPPYDAVLLAGGELGRRPRAMAALASLVGAIDGDTMRRLNLAVDRDGRSPARVARDWLEARPAERAPDR